MCSWTPGDETDDPGRIVRSQAEFLTLASGAGPDRRPHRRPAHPQGAGEAADGGAVRDADVITIRVLDATRRRRPRWPTRSCAPSVGRRPGRRPCSPSGEAAATERRQQQLENQLAELDQQLQDDPTNSAPGQPRRQAESARGAGREIEAVRRGAARRPEGRGVPGDGGHPRRAGAAQAAAHRGHRRAAGPDRRGRAGVVAERAPPAPGADASCSGWATSSSRSSPGPGWTGSPCAWRPACATASPVGQRLRQRQRADQRDRRLRPDRHVGPGAVPLPGRAAPAAVRGGPSAAGGGGDRPPLPGRPGRHPARQRRRGPDDGQRRPPGEPDRHHRPRGPPPHRDGGAHGPRLVDDDELVRLASTAWEATRRTRSPWCR